MPLELGVWRIGEKPIPIEASGMDEEKRLEDVLAAEIIEDLQSTLQELQAISNDLAQTPGAQEGDSDARIED